MSEYEGQYRMPCPSRLGREATSRLGLMSAGSVPGAFTARSREPTYTMPSFSVYPATSMDWPGGIQPVLSGAGGHSVGLATGGTVVTGGAETAAASGTGGTVLVGGAGSTGFTGTGGAGSTRGAGSTGFDAGVEAVIVKAAGAGRGATGLGSSGMRTMSPGEILGALTVSKRSAMVEAGGAE